MNFFDTQNPGIGGLDELTTQETIVVQNIAALGDPGADRILFWDSSAGGYQFLTAGSGLTITGTTISASGLTNPMTTGGDIIYGGVAGVPTRLANGSAGQVLQSNGTTLAPSWAAAGAGDMILAFVQTNSAAKTFLDTTFFLRNVANTFSGSFVNTNTANRVYTLKDSNGTLAFTSDITGTNSGTNTGDQTITLTGDVTGSGTGSFAATIGANKVTLAQMATIATDSILGRATAAAGNVEVLTALPFAFTGDVTRPADSNTTTIATSAVTLAKMADVATSTVFYRKTAGTGAPEVQTLATLKTDLGLTGTNSGDQTSISGISGTKAQFNTAVSDGDIVYLDSIDTITGVKTMSGLNVILHSSSGLTIRNPADTFKYTITAAAIAADRVLNLPLITGTDTLAALGLAQTWTGTQTFTAPVLGTPASGTLTNCTFPTLNQNTTGSAASLSVSGQTGLITMTGILSTNRIKTVRDAADTILELGGSYTPTGTWTSMTLVTPALGTPASGVMTNVTGTATGLTSGITNALKSATTTVDVSAATAPTNGQVLTATSGTTATWQTPGAGSGTVTATGGSLTSNSVVLGAGTTDTKVVAGITTDGTSQINLGVNTTTLGKIKMFGNTSGDVTINPAAVAGTATVQTLPATTGTLVNRVTTANGVSASNSDGALTVTLGAITPTTVNGLTVGPGLGAVSGNTAVGVSALSTTNGSASGNTAIGSQALLTLLSGTVNTAVGRNALYFNSTGDGNVAIGYSAGQYETGSNAFYVDNQNRANTAGDKAGALLYGTFNATPSSQTLTVNAGTLTTIGTIELGHASDTTLARASAGVVSIEGNNILVSGGALGTPSSGTLTNATGLPVSGITASTITALGVGSIELGHASDTTLARVSAGVASIEGKNIALNGTGETLTTGSIELGHASDTTVSRSAAGVLAVEGVVIPSISSTNTLTNKRVTKRVTSTSGPGATPTINTDNCDAVHLTVIAAAITSMTTNLSGTPVEGDMLRIDFTDNGTARAITWGSSFESSTATLPTTTVISTRLDVGFVWNSATSKWRCIAVA